MKQAGTAGIHTPLSGRIGVPGWGAWAGLLQTAPEPAEKVLYTTRSTIHCA